MGLRICWLGAETGANLTGDGIPDIVIDTWGGAADGGAGTLIYEAGDNLKQIMDAGSQYPGSFEDLNKDGSYEYIAPTRIWSQLDLVHVKYGCQLFMNIKERPVMFLQPTIQKYSCSVDPKRDK